MTEDYIFQCFEKINDDKSKSLHSLFLKSDNIFKTYFTIKSPEIIWDSIIVSFLKIDFKKHLNSFDNNSANFFEFIFDIVNKISSNTFYSIHRAMFLLEYYIDNFIQFLPQKDLISYANLNTTNESTIILGALLNSLIIAKSIYHKVITENFKYENEDKINSSEIGFNQGIGINEKTILNYIANWLFALLFNDTQIIQVIPIFFKNLIRQSIEQSKLAMEIIGDKNDISEFMLNLIFHYRFIRDPQSLSFLEWCTNSSAKDYDSKKQFTLEQLLFNSSIPDASKKTHLIIEILRGYLIEQYDYDYTSTAMSVDYTIMCYVFCYFFLSPYSLLHELTGCIFKQYENINDISQRRLNDLCLCFIEYSLFVIDYMRQNTSIIQSSSEEIRYNCLYTYIEYSGLLSSFFPFGALVSCYLLKEIISLFSFKEQLPKVLFNYLCFLYQVNKKYSFANLMQQFFNFIIKEIDYTNATSFNEWYFLSLGVYNTIPYFTIKDQSDIVEWNRNSLLLMNNLIKITEQLPYIRHYEAEILLEYINTILNDSEIYQIINTSQNILYLINQMLSYLLFHYDFIASDFSDCNFYNSESFNHIIFCIINKLSIDVDEYFYLPKNYEEYSSFSSFLFFIKQKINSHILQSSFLPFEVLSLKLSISNYHKNNNDILASFLLVYVNNTKNCNIETRQDKKIGKDLLELLHYSTKLTKEEVKVIEELITSDLYHLDICLFILMQLLSNSCTDEILYCIYNFMNNLIEATQKLEFTYFLTIIKFFTNLFSSEYDQIDYYIKEKNDNSLSTNSIINSNNQLSAKHKGLSKELIERINVYKIQKSYWETISKKLNSNNAYANYISSLNNRNYPKTCINLAEWRIYQDMRELNCQSLSTYPKGELIYYYYNSLCKLDDNAQMLQSFCMDKSIQTILNKYCQNNFKPLNNTNSNIYKTSHFLQLSEAFFKSLIIKQLETAVQFEINDINNLETLAVFIFLKRLIDINSLLNTKNINRVKILKKKWDMFIRGYIKKSFNKMQGEIYGTMTNIAICYDIDTIINVIYNETNKCVVNNNDTFTFLLPNITINEALKKMIIQKPLSIISKNLLQFKIRRAICSFALEYELELQCLIGIMKIYKVTRSFLKLNEYFDEYKHLILSDKNFTYISNDMLYLCLKYQFDLFPTQIGEFMMIYDIYLQKSNKKPEIKYELLQLKVKEKNGFRMENILLLLKNQISLKDIDGTPNEDYCLRANLYLEYLRYIHKKHFDKFNKEIITIHSLSKVLFEYLSIALKICLTTTNKKLLTVYLPQLMNYIFKIQKLFKDNNKINQSANRSYSKMSKISGTKSIKKGINKSNEYHDEFETILIEMKLLSNINIKIILPQLLICYSVPGTLLYQLAVDLLVKFTNENIDISAPWLAAYLSTSEKDIDALYQRGMDKQTYSKLYVLSRQFGEHIKRLLTNANQKIISQYEYFQSRIKDLFIKIKKKKNDKKNDTNTIINEINTTIKNNQYLIILPILSNINTYNPKLREDLSKIKKNKHNAIFDLKHYNTLFISEISENVNIILSKEAPIKITFYSKTLFEIYNKKDSKGVEYSFVLKGDVIDITKELKSTELFNEINSIFKLKSYDINYQMSLKQYLISPVTSHIVLVEWLVGTKTLLSISDELKKKFAVETAKLKLNNKNYAQGEFAKIKETINVLFYHYYLNYPNPNDWWNAKRAYVISTAVWSMTCFFSGVGDRHLGNIMIGPTGEIIHIDFGYVLGKGTILPVPEIVPFRYTRNLRRNLGIFEENGLFIFISKKVIDLFKEYYTPLISRVEYYLFDPYSDEFSNNYMINKLDQLECFFLRDFSFDQSHIKIYSLIQESKIDENLEKMFYGWSADF